MKEQRTFVQKKEKSRISFLSIFFLCSFFTESLKMWNPAKDQLGSMCLSEKIDKRFENLRRGNLMHLTESQVLLVRQGEVKNFSLHKGLESKEPIPVGTYLKKHPKLPLAFVYPSVSAGIFTGELYVTTDATEQDNVVDRNTGSSSEYNSSIPCREKVSSKKRLFCFEDEEAEDSEKNFLT